MPEAKVPDEHAIRVSVTEACALAAGQSHGRHELHQLLQQAVARLSSTFALQAQTEYPLPRYRGDRNGYLDVVWKHDAIPVVAFEIDSALRIKSLEKLLAVNANLRFWIYYGRDDTETARRFDPAGMIRIIELESDRNSVDQTLLNAMDASIMLNTSLVPTSDRSDRPVSGAEIEKQYLRAYERWTPDDDRTLKMLYKNGEGIWELATRFQRKPDAIRSRLRKLGLLDDQGLP